METHKLGQLKERLSFDRRLAVSKVFELNAINVRDLRERLLHALVNDRMIEHKEFMQDEYKKEISTEIRHTGVFDDAMVVVYGAFTDNLEEEFQFDYNKEDLTLMRIKQFSFSDKKKAVWE